MNDEVDRCDLFYVQMGVKTIYILRATTLVRNIWTVCSMICNPKDPYISRQIGVEFTLNSFGLVGVTLPVTFLPGGVVLLFSSAFTRALYMYMCVRSSWSVAAYVRVLRASSLYVRVLRIVVTGTYEYDVPGT